MKLCGRMPRSSIVLLALISLSLRLAAQTPQSPNASARASSKVWVADNGTGLSTLYTGTGSIVPLVVTIPPPQGAEGPSAPTGLVFNGTGEFVVKAHDLSGSAFFIFDTEDGTISGWNPTVDLHNAILAVDNSASAAVYKGLAIDSPTAGTQLYATNFHAGTVDVFDSSFNLVTLPLYLVALFVAGLGAVLFYGINGWLTARLYYEQVALRRRNPAEVKTWRKANAGVLWLTGIVIVFLGTIPILNLIVPVLGTAAMVHVAQTLRPPANLR